MPRCPHEQEQLIQLAKIVADISVVVDHDQTSGMHIQVDHPPKVAVEHALVSSMRSERLDPVSEILPRISAMLMESW